MIPLSEPELEYALRLLKKLELRSAISNLGGLLANPALQANAVRIEPLVHLAVLSSAGSRRAKASTLRDLLNQRLANTPLREFEDPAEDVFVSNIETPHGNRRLFQGIWQSPDYYLQASTTLVASATAPRECQELLKPASALLRVSDLVAERLGYSRWLIETSAPSSDVFVNSNAKLEELAGAITFSPEELDTWGISAEDLGPFILRAEDRMALANETVGNSSLERRPLVEIDGDLILALLNAVSPAIRRFLLESVNRLGHLGGLEGALAELQAHQVERSLRELYRYSISLPVLDPESPTLPIHSWLLQYDCSKFVHVVLLHDDLAELLTQGLSSFREYSKQHRAALERHIAAIAELCQSKPNFHHGLTLLVLGGLGRGVLAGFDTWPAAWQMASLDVPDLLMLASEEGEPMKRFLKCMLQKHWAEDRGVKFSSLDGDYNFYCYWRSQDFKAVPNELSIRNGSAMWISSDMVLQGRTEARRRSDRHVLSTPGGEYISVTRLGRESYFESVRTRPVYVSEEFLRAGRLTGAVETKRGCTWFTIPERPGDERVRRILYEVWVGFIEIVDRVVVLVEEACISPSVSSIEVRLDFSEVEFPEIYTPVRDRSDIPEPKISFDCSACCAAIYLPANFLRHFQEPENVGERTIVRAIAVSLQQLHGGTECDVEDIEREVINDSSIRVLHLFNTRNEIDILLARTCPSPRFLAMEDLAFSRMELTDGCSGASESGVLETKDECNDLLHEVVDKIWATIRDQLRNLDRANVVFEVLGIHEAALQDRDHWRRTAGSVIALYGEDEALDAANEREAARTAVSLASRVILEMAICECPNSGGRSATDWELDALLAKAALLVEVAMDSDAVVQELTDPRIEVEANGDYSIDRVFQKTVLGPFRAAQFREEFTEAANRYSESYRTSGIGERKAAAEFYSDEFLSAFRAEFGLTVDEAMDSFAALVSVAVSEDTCVIEMSLQELRKKVGLASDVGSDVLKRYLEAFAIQSRVAWDEPPSGFGGEDIWPWRYRRRLSIAARPILVLGDTEQDKVIFGVGTLRRGFGYILDGAERGLLPQRSLSSQEMKAYSGGAAVRRGHAFARETAERLNKQGWKTRCEVQMTELGAAADLGDVDVFAWNEERRVIVIECKCLQLARTVKEIAEICKRFRGDAKDALDRHIQRVAWIRDHLCSLEQITGFVPTHGRVLDRLVTNVRVPIQYLHSLPLTAEKIGPLENAGKL